MNKLLQQRFWSKVDKQGPFPDPKKYPNIKTRCWIWLGCLNEKGYGLIKIDGSSRLAHRVAWYLRHGSFAEKHTLHKCDNKRCVRHLFEGDDQDNTDDKVSKQRHAKGESAGGAKLTNRQVLEIRKLYATGGYFKTTLARNFGVNINTIHKVLSHKTFKHI